MEQSLENVVHALSGAGGGMISMALTYPLITIGTRMQIQKNSQSKKAYKGFLDAVGKILHKEGVAGFYSGLDSALFGIALTNGVYYYWYEHVKGLFLAASSEKSMNAIESLLAGALAGSATVMITNPVWVINTRITTGKGSKTIDEEDSPSVSTQTSPATSQTALNAKHSRKKRLTSWSVLWDLIKEDGILSLWQGVWPALVLVANPSIQYMVFEQLKSRLEKTRSLTTVDHFLLGALSKLVATFLTYPYIVVKSRMQLKQKQDSPKSTFVYLKQILSEEGLRGLYKGVGSKLVQSVLTAAILFWAKESLVEVSRESLLFLLSLTSASFNHGKRLIIKS